MKINISPTESYTLKIPEQIDLQEFEEILTKLDGIMKIVKINLITGTNLTNFKEKFNHRAEIKANLFKTGRGYKSRFYDTREKVLDIMQYFYHGTKEDKERVAKLIGKTPNEISKRFWSLSKKYKITNDEIGLISNRNQILGIPLTKQPNYTIKSYTGIFDEPEN